jgi:hypothetical protein
MKLMKTAAAFNGICIMKSKRQSKSPKGEVILVGLDKDHQIVAEERISVFDYYDSLCPILDDNRIYRQKRGIRFVKGVIYNYEGTIDQEFINTYDENGTYIGSKIMFSDGTVSES